MDKERILKRAKKVVDNNMNVELALLDESILMNEKLDTLISKEDIEIPSFPEFPELPEFPSEITISNLPETQKVEVVNFPEQKAPIVNVPVPIVNVEAPIVEMNNDEVVAELKNISEILSKEEDEGIEKTEIVDEKGEVVDFKKLFTNLSDRIANIRVTGGGGFSGLSTTDSIYLSNIGKSYAIKIDDVSTALTTYIGKADTGSSGSTANWRIKKIDETGAYPIITWANGSDSFTNVWDNRTSLTYI